MSRHNFSILCELTEGASLVLQHLGEDCNKLGHKDGVRGSKLPGQKIIESRHVGIRGLIMITIIYW